MTDPQLQALQRLAARLDRARRTALNARSQLRAAIQIVCEVSDELDELLVQAHQEAQNEQTPQRRQEPART